MDFGAISWLGVILGAVAFFGIGGLWYGPLFGKQWMAAAGVTEEEARTSNMPLLFGGTLVMELVAGIALAAVIGAEATPASGAVTGLWIGLLIVVPLLVVLNLYERRSWMLWALNGGYNLIGLVAMGAVIGALQ